MWGKPKFDIEAEENNIRKNLSRLIHTLQHFPSKRSGLDTTSLWNLVDELESFNPDRKTNSMQFTQTTERKTYCKKSVNLHICNGNGKSVFVPGSYRTSEKFKDGESAEKGCGDSSRYNSNQFKKKFLQKSNTKNNNFSCTGKDKSSSNNIGTKNKSKIINNVEVRGNNFERSNAGTHNYVNRRNLQKSENSALQNKSTVDSLKDPIQNMNKNVNLSDSKYKINCNSKKIQSVHKYATKKKSGIKGCNMVLNKENNNKIVNFKSRSHQCTPKTNKALQQIISDNNRQSVDQRSVVKKLTNYWNNLLNNEFAQCSSTIESSSESSRNVQSLDHLTEGSFNKSDTLSENSNSTLKSRHLSESNINIMKRVEDLDLKKSIHIVQNSRNKLSSTTENTRTGSVPSNLSVKIYKNNSLQALDRGKKNLKGSLHQYSKQIDKNIILSTEDVIEELQKIICTLKSFPTCDLLSDEVLLPLPLAKKCLYIMVGTSMLKSQNATLLNKLEGHTDQMIQEIVEKRPEIKSSNSKIKINIDKLTDIIPANHIMPSLNNKLEFEMNYMFTDNKENTEDIFTQVQERTSSIKCCQRDETVNKTDEIIAIKNCESTCDPENALMIPRINMTKVQNAMKLFMAWRENICSQSFYNYDEIPPMNYDEIPPFHSFTFMYRQDIFFDEEFSDEDDEDTEEDLENDCETISDMYRSTAAKIDQYINTVIDVLENYWLDSPEVIVTMIYQALVSILIWWVLVKELLLN